MRTAPAALIAPAPQFLLTLLVLLRPDFGWEDVGIGLLVAFLFSYGFMFAAGLPILRWVQKNGRGLSLFVVALCVAALTAVLLLTAAELLWSAFGTADAGPFQADDSPFAGASLAGGGWVTVCALWLPLVVIMATLLYILTARSTHSS